MFWETLWALVLGFGLSGAVQAFVSKDDMQRADGRPPPRGSRPGVGVRDDVVVVLLRGDRHGQVAVPEGRGLHLGHGLHVRLHQPGDRARCRAGDPHGLAVRRGRVHRRADHDHPARRVRRLRVPGCAGPPGAGAAPAGDGRRSRPPGHGRRLRGTPGRARAHALAPEAHLEGGVVRRRQLHDGRHHHAAERSWSSATRWPGSWR